MALFGEKCGRCGRRTRHQYKGTPTCEACEQDLETRMKAASEETRKCPLDGAEMQKQVVLGIIIDRCGSCKGVWLDGGELEQIKGNVEAVAARDLLRGMTYPI